MVDEDAGKYLFGVAYNQCANHWRTSKRNLYMEEMPEQKTENNINQNLLNQNIQSALNILTDQQKALVLLKDYEGYSYEEMAEITKLNASQVKVYLHRARLKLQTYIGKLENII